MNNSSFKIYLRVLSYIRPYYWHIIGAVVFSILFAAANVLFMPLTRDIFNGIAIKSVSHVNNHMINAFLLYGLRQAVKGLLTYMMTYIALQAVNGIRIQVFEKLQALSLDFHAKWTMGDLITRIFTDAEKLKQSLIQNFEEVVPNVLTLIGVIGYLVYLNWRLTLLAGLGIPVFIFLISWFTERIKKVTGQAQRKMSNLTQIFQESISNIALVQAFTAEHTQTAKFKKSINRNFVALMKETRIRATQIPLVAYLHFCIFAFVLWYGAYEVAKGLMTGPDLASFFAGTLLLIDPVLALSNIYTATQQSIVSADRIFEIMDSPASITNQADPVMPSKFDGGITFDHVSFRYSADEREVLSDFHLAVEPGEIIALVGMSGAGKSTLVNLLPRFFDPSSGTISIDGTSLEKMDIATLRSNIAIVPQDTTLFRGTLLENLRYGNPDATEDEITQATKQANAWEFIERLPHQLYAKAGENGVNLSGGQKQRIAIARAILRDPRILILDEATSALDSESEQLVQEALEKLMTNRTTFVIAHRLGTIKHADRIVVMDQGVIQEIGSHDELIEKNGAYAKLYHTQFQPVV